MTQVANAGKAGLEPTGKRRIAAPEDTGHPNAVIIRHSNRGKLHDLLLAACPPDDRGRKSITVLAGLLGMSPWGIHKWINKGKIPPGRASQVVDLSDGRVTLAAFSPFIYV